MNGRLVARPSTSTVPVLITAAGERTGIRFLEFFAGQIRNPHTRRAYARAVRAKPRGRFSATANILEVPDFLL